MAWIQLAHDRADGKAMNLRISVEAEDPMINLFDCPLGRPICRWVDTIEMDLEEVGWGGMEWAAVVHDRDTWRALVYAVMNLRDPSMR